MVMIDLKTLRPVQSKEELRAVCPMAFASHPSRDVSDKYVFVNTETVIDDLEKLGWFPVAAFQRKVRKADTPSKFSRHMVIFQNPDVVVSRGGEDKMAATIILSNSHDGTSTFQFRMGLYRAACENGLVLPEEEFTAFRIRHIGYTFQSLQENIQKVVELVPSKVELLNKMTATELTEEQIVDMAIKAMLIRAGVSPQAEDVPTYSPETIQAMLTPKREADKASDLWTVFNRVQEAVIRGGFQVEVEGKRSRKLKPVKSFEKDLVLNQQLFELALSYTN
jgi:hypothetical protein